MNEAPFLPRRNKTGSGQRLQVEGERRRRHAQRLADGAYGHALRAGFDEQAPHGKTRGLCERGELADDGFRFHSSNYIEMFAGTQPREQLDAQRQLTGVIGGHRPLLQTGISAPAASRRTRAAVEMGM